MNLSSLENVVYQLAADIIEEKALSNRGVDLYAGTSGILIFFCLLHKYTKKEKYANYCYELINTTLNNLASLEGKGSLSGYAGVMWTLLYLVKLNFIDYDSVKEYINELKKLVITSSHNNLRIRDFDLMHGLVGELFALNELYEFSPKENEEILPTLEQGINHLNSICIKQENSEVYWQSIFENSAIVNTGLAHGVSCVIWFLSKIVSSNKINIDIRKTCLANIEGACNWLINRKKRDKKSLFQIPCSIYLKKIDLPSIYSFAWCHGDLGISLALLRSGKLLNNQRIQQEAVDLALNLSEMDFKQSQIMQDENYIDSSLCHGTYGAFFMLYILHKRTNQKKIKVAYKYWLDLIKKRLNKNYSFLDQKFGLRNDNNIIWKTSPGLLNGASGYALVILTYIMIEKNIKVEQDWFDIFA